METYTFLRELADSWVLLAMFTFFLGVILWAFRPGSTATYKAVAAIPLREDERPNCQNCKNCSANKGADNV